VPMEIRALARVRHRAEDEVAVLEGRLDAGDPRRPVGTYGGNGLVSVRVEQRPHALRELRLRLLDLAPCRHAPMIAPSCGGTADGGRQSHLQSLPSGSQWLA